MKVYDLKPGMLIKGFAGINYAIVIAVHNPHPKRPNFSLVLWKVSLDDGGTYFSHDCLLPNQDVGELANDNDSETCWERLLNILPGNK